MLNDNDHGEIFISFLINQLSDDSSAFKMQLIHSEEAPFYDWINFNQKENSKNADIKNLCQNNLHKKLFKQSFPIHFIYDIKVSNVSFNLFKTRLFFKEKNFFFFLVLLYFCTAFNFIINFNA